jgi:hypothetical protein
MRSVLSLSAERFSTAVTEEAAFHRLGRSGRTTTDAASREAGRRRRIGGHIVDVKASVVALLTRLIWPLTVISALGRKSATKPGSAAHVTAPSIGLRFIDRPE